MNDKVRVAVVGCGYWGPNLIRNFRSLPDCELTDICDVNANRLKHLKSLYPDVMTHASFGDMLAGRELDAVVVATPVCWHHPLAMESLRAGKHVMIEKPMARSVKECEDMAAVASAGQRTLMVGHTFLYSPHVKKIKEIIQAGEIGDVLYVSSRRLNLGLFQDDINVVWDLAPHDISIIAYLLEEMPVSVNCQGNAHLTRGVEDVSNMTLRFASGRYATIQTSWLDPRKVREITIVGTRKMIVYDDVEPMHKIKIYDQHVEKPPHYDSFAEFHYAYHYGDVFFPYVKQEEPLKAECRHFLECIRTGAPPMTSARLGTGVVRVLEMASASLGQGGGQVAVRPEVQSGE